MQKKYLSKFAKKNRKARTTGKVGRGTTKAKAVSFAAPKNRVRNPPLRFKRGGGKHKEIIKQESLGQQTENKLSFRVGRPDTRARVMKSVGASSYYMKNQQYVLSSAGAGIQNCFTFYNGNQAMLSNIANQLANVLGYSTSTQPQRYLLENIHHTLTFSNNSTAPCRLKVYFINSKRDTWFPPSGNPADQMVYTTPGGVNYYWDGTPQGAFDVGLEAEANIPPGTTFPSTLVGNVPTESKLFTDFFKIEREIEVEMATGGVHTLEFNRHFDKVMDASIYSSDPYIGIKGVTQWIMTVAVGAPVVITTGADIHKMTTAQVQLGVIEVLNHRYTQVQSALSTININSNLAIAANADTSTINSGSGTAGAPQIVS